MLNGSLDLGSADDLFKITDSLFSQKAFQLAQNVHRRPEIGQVGASYLDRCSAGHQVLQSILGGEDTPYPYYGQVHRLERLIHQR